MEYVFENAKIFNGKKIIPESKLFVAQNKIKKISNETYKSDSIQSIDCHDMIITPGFIDLQVNGGGDCLFNDDLSATGINTILKAHQKLGTTSILPTFITDDKEKIPQAVQAVSESKAINKTGVLGVHIEGPFIDSTKKGVHSKEKILKWDKAYLSDFKEWKSKTNHLLLTFAPENIPEKDILTLKDMGIVMSLGHTNASYDLCIKAIQAGATSATHLYNAMSSILARDPGCVGASLSQDSVWCGLIADGHHLHVDLLRETLRYKNHTYFVSDAMPPIGGKKKAFEFFGEKLYLEGSVCKTKQGQLGGSATSLLSAVKYCMDHAICELETALQNVTYNPASVIGVQETIGSLHEGAEANFLILNQKLDLIDVYFQGKKVI